MPQITPTSLPRWIGQTTCVIGFAVTLSLSGCSSLWRGKTDETDQGSGLRELMKAPAPPDLVREATVPQGMRPIQVDGVGAVNGLPGTGGPANPSSYRDQLLDEMKRHDVADPNHFLERNDTAMVRVRASIPPGARRGDSVDIRILAPKESQVSDLHGGRLLDTRLRQQQVLQNAVRESEVLAIAIGPVLTRADYHPGTDAAMRVEGNILNGGRVQVTRKLGLVLRPKYQHVKMAAAISSAINQRFFFFDGTTRRGISKAMEDDYIEIDVHPRYRDNLVRLMDVVQTISVKPESADTQERLADLAERLARPSTARDAALQLEGIGESAVPTLLEGAKSSNPELRFYAAEALAYLDRSEAIEPLEEAAREVAAFRPQALLALQGLDQQLAIDALQRLISEPSLETRYGSFCAIRRRIDGKRTLAGKALGSFWLYRVPSTAQPAIVVSLRESPEIVLMGETTSVSIPEFIRLPGGWLIKPEPNSPDKLRISRFQPGRKDQRATVSSSVQALIEGIVAVGGGYGDVIAVLRTAKDEGYLADQLAIDPLPKSTRTYFRNEASNDGPSISRDSDAEDGSSNRAS